MTIPPSSEPSPRHPSPGALDWAFPILLGAAVVLIPSLRALGPIYDPDVWWHLRAGEWILDHKTFPLTDPFSRLGIEEQRRWYAPGWLWEAALAIAYREFGPGGFAAIAWGMAVAVALVTLTACHRLSGRFLWAALGTGGVMCAISPIINVRSYMVSVVFSTAIYGILLDHRRTGRARALWLLPPMFALWSNLHIQLLYGYFLVTAAASEPLLIAAARRWGPDSWRRLEPPASSARTLTAVLIASAAASACNPYGFGWWLVVWDHVAQTGQFQWLNELTPPALLTPSYAVATLLTLAAAGTLVRLRRDDPFLYAILGVSFILFLRAQRDVWFPAMVSALTLSLVAAPRSEPIAIRREWLRPALAGLLAILAIAASGKLRWLSSDEQDREIASRFPVQAAQAIRERDWAGPLYNHLNWGGYLMRALPDHPVAVDGRANAHRDDGLKMSYDVWSGLAAWRDDPLLQSANLVVARPDSPLTSILRLSQRFLVVYEDPVAVVFLRVNVLEENAD